MRPAEMFDRPVLIFNSEDWLARGVLAPRGIHFSGELPEDDLNGVTPIRLAYHGNSHYTSVMPSDAGEGNDSFVAGAVAAPGGTIRYDGSLQYEHSCASAWSTWSDDAGRLCAPRLQL